MSSCSAEPHKMDLLGTDELRRLAPQPTFGLSDRHPFPRSHPDQVRFIYLDKFGLRKGAARIGLVLDRLTDGAVPVVERGGPGAGFSPPSSLMSSWFGSYPRRRRESITGASSNRSVARIAMATSATTGTPAGSCLRTTRGGREVDADRDGAQDARSTVQWKGCALIFHACRSWLAAACGSTGVGATAGTVRCRRPPV